MRVHGGSMSFLRDCKGSIEGRWGSMKGPWRVHEGSMSFWWVLEGRWGRLFYRWRDYLHLGKLSSPGRDYLQVKIMSSPIIVRATLQGKPSKTFLEPFGKPLRLLDRTALILLDVIWTHLNCLGEDNREDNLFTQTLHPRKIISSQVKIISSPGLSSPIKESGWCLVTLIDHWAKTATLWWSINHKPPDQPFIISIMIIIIKSTAG